MNFNRHKHTKIMIDRFLNKIGTLFFKYTYFRFEKNSSTKSNDDQFVISLYVNQLIFNGIFRTNVTRLSLLSL